MENNHRKFLRSLSVLLGMNMQGFELSGELVEIGGIAGLVNRGLIANCYTLGSIVGSAYHEAQLIRASIITAMEAI